MELRSFGIFDISNADDYCFEGLFFVKLPFPHGASLSFRHPDIMFRLEHEPVHGHGYSSSHVQTGGHAKPNRTQVQEIECEY